MMIVFFHLVSDHVEQLQDDLWKLNTGALWQRGGKRDVARKEEEVEKVCIALLFPGRWNER